MLFLPVVERSDNSYEPSHVPYQHISSSSGTTAPCIRIHSIDHRNPFAVVFWSKTEIFVLLFLGKNVQVVVLVRQFVPPKVVVLAVTDKFSQIHCRRIQRGQGNSGKSARK